MSSKLWKKLERESKLVRRQENEASALKEEVGRSNRSCEGAKKCCEKEELLRGKCW